MATLQTYSPKVHFHYGSITTTVGGSAVNIEIRGKRIIHARFATREATPVVAELFHDTVVDTDNPVSLATSATGTLIVDYVIQCVKGVGSVVPVRTT